MRILESEQLLLKPIEEEDIINCWNSGGIRISCVIHFMSQYQRNSSLSGSTHSQRKI
jgi:hypothetical protein